MYERLQTIRLRLMGMPVREIATILCRSEKTIRIYIHAFEKEGVSGLPCVSHLGDPRDSRKKSGTS